MMDDNLLAAQIKHNVPNFNDPRITYVRDAETQMMYVDDLPVYGVDLPPAKKVLTDEELYELRLRALLDFELQTETIKKELESMKSNRFDSVDPELESFNTQP